MKNLFFILFILFLFGCSNKKWKQYPSGVIYEYNIENGGGYKVVGRMYYKLDSVSVDTIYRVKSTLEELN